jgi:aryl-alcohol dehydrogenase-like predicted oxidoreductase
MQCKLIFSKIYFVIAFLFMLSVFSYAHSVKNIFSIVSLQQKYNPQLQSKKEEFKKAVSEYERALKAYLPDLKLNLNGQRRRNIYRDSNSSQYGGILNFGSKHSEKFQNINEYLEKGKEVLFYL